MRPKHLVLAIEYFMKNLVMELSWLENDKALVDFEKTDEKILKQPFLQMKKNYSE